jgi:predicted PurR-regulated permease PerM
LRGTFAILGGLLRDGSLKSSRLNTSALRGTLTRRDGKASALNTQARICHKLSVALGGPIDLELESFRRIRQGLMFQLLPSRPTRGISSIPGSTLTTILVVVVTVGALYFGREVLVPIALALLLSFVLAPLVRRLQSWHFPRIAAVSIVGIFAFSTIFGLGAFMVSQVSQLANDLPRYQSTLTDKIQSLQGAVAGTGPLERASDVLKDLKKEIDRSGSVPPAEPSLSGQVQPSRPIPVEVRQPDPGALQVLAALIEPLIHPLTTTGIVVIFVIFILLQQNDLRNRLVRLAGAKDLHRTTAALDDAGQRLSRLFLTQLALNAAFGFVIGTALWLIGVPSAPLWGMLAMIMRFVPYIGALISAIFPLVLAAAVGPGWTMVLMTAALFLIAETLVGQAIEPMIYGHSTGLSPVAVITAATFWTWLWGPIGLILATPLTMCLVVLGRHVDQLKFLEVMFGDEPPLTPAELIYQRMLARDPVEAADQARVFLKEKPLAAYYDEILLEGLRLAQADAQRGLLDEDRMNRIRDAVAEIVDDLATHTDVIKLKIGPAEEHSPLAQLETAEARAEEKTLPERWRNGKPVLCIPGPSLLDEAVATMVAHLVEQRGVGARAEKIDALSISRILNWETKGVELICLCYVEYATPAQIRYAIRRIRRRIPEVSILVALLGNAERFEDDETFADAEFVQQSLRETVDKIMAVALKQTGDEISAAKPAAAHL